MPELTIDGVLGAVQRLPALPQVVMDLIELFDRDEVDMAAIGERIEKDQAIAARVLRLANSPFYGMSGRIATINDGMKVLGLRNLHGLTVAAGVTNCFPSRQAPWFDHGLFWSHTIAAAMSARVLAVRFDLVNPALAFTAGLLHDIGKLVLVTGFPDAYREVIRLKETEGYASAQAESIVLGLDHAMVGAALAQRWKFSSLIQAAISHHHDADVAGAELLTDLLQAADVTAHLLDGTLDPAGIVPAPTGLVWARVLGDWETFRQILPAIEAEKAEAAASLGLSKENTYA